MDNWVARSAVRRDEVLVARGHPGESSDGSRLQGLLQGQLPGVAGSEGGRDTRGDAVTRDRRCGARGIHSDRVDGKFTASFTLAPLGHDPRSTQ
jgi:hypothetical protein